MALRRTLAGGRTTLRLTATDRTQTLIVHLPTIRRRAPPGSRRRQALPIPSWVVRNHAEIRARRRCACAVATLACVLLALGGGQAAPALGAAPVGQCTSTHWVGAWTADPSGTLTGGYQDETVRIVLTPHVGAERLRVHLSNRNGPGPVTFAHATVALSDTGAAIVGGSTRPLTFGGAPRVTVPAGADVTSDPVGLGFTAFQDLAVSLYAAGATGPATDHTIARQHSYDTGQATGDHTGDASAGAFVDAITSAPFVDGVDAVAPTSVGAAVVFGDSITDGYESAGGSSAEQQAGIDANHRFPDYLARRLLAVPGGPGLSVLNAGISGNRLLADGQADGGGPAGVTRIDSDVLGVAGVTDVIVLEGINDIALQANAGQVTGALADIVAALHARGLHVLLGTIIPAGTGLLSVLPGLYLDSPANAVRVAVNGWIRSGDSGADGVIDFDAALRGQAQPNVLDPSADSGDHLHPSDAGYSRMADAVDIASLRGAQCTPPAATRLVVRAATPSAGRLRVSGSLISAAGRSGGCGGSHVTLRALHSGRTVLKRNLAVSSACHFAATKPLAARGRIEIRVGFAGSPTLLAAHAKTVFVRAR
jgi:lysophospholipase L1-like esterase